MSDKKGLITRLTDGYANFMANIGIGTDNVASGGDYAFDFLTLNRVKLEALYRSSWIIAAAVDMHADDMTQAGIEIQSTMPPDKIDILQEGIDDLKIWSSLNSTLKWSRLYGSGVGVYMIDGQDMSTPLRLDTIGKGQFKGILALDRWQFNPSLGDISKEFGPDLGKPEYYTCLPDALLPNLGPIHRSRLIILDCIEMPHYQKLTLNLWGESIVERIWDRLLAFDSTTQGAAQLVFKAYLRTWKVKNLREILSNGGAGQANLEKNVQFVRRFQSNEGITLMDANDEFDTHQYTFAGLDDVLASFGQQLAGALEIPLVRLFGTSPKGMNATGESDLRNYYDSVRRKQQTVLRPHVKKILAATHRSLFGAPLPDGFAFEFNPLWQSTDGQKSDMAQKDTGAITQAYEAGIVSREVALKELRQSSKTNGMWSNIEDDDIKDAEGEVPLSEFQPDPEAMIGAESGEEENAE